MGRQGALLCFAAIASFISVLPVCAETESEPHVAVKQLPVLVTGSRIPSSPSKVGSSTSVYEVDENRTLGETTVAEALRHIPGLDVVQSGGAGGNVAVFMRGANSEHTLMLLDGIELNNPGSTSRSFSLANFSLENVERIEVIRGPQSTIYGSDALGGVINIITRRGKKPGAIVSSEAGGYGQFTQQGSVWGGTDEWQGSFGVTRKDVDSFSAADERFGNDEDDGHGLTSLTGRTSWRPLDHLEASVVGRYGRSYAAIDNGGGPGGDDPNRRLKNKEAFVRGQIQTDVLDKALAQTVGISYSDHFLRDNNDTDPLHPTDLLRSRYQGSLLKTDVANTWRIDDSFQLVTGAEWERERATSQFFSDGEFGPFTSDLEPADVSMRGLFAEGRADVDEIFFANAGIRIDDHSIFGERTTWRLSPSVRMGEGGTRLKGSVGTGFKAPSLVQLYSSFGNPELRPEESTGWDLGVEQSFLDDDAVVSVTFFRNTFDNLVTFNSSTFLLDNVANASTEGFEVTGRYRLSSAWEFSGGYTYTDSEDATTGQSLLRRPRNKFVFDAAYNVTEALTIRAFARLVGQAFDNDFSTAVPTRVRLGGYMTMNVAVNFKLSESFELFSRVENLFDKEYQEVDGFNTSGVAGFGGIRFAL
jgi:vitamin B12 transporter